MCCQLIVLIQTALSLTVAAASAVTTPSAVTPTAPTVEVEEDVYRYEPANNGAGPMWCSGSTCLVRIGDRVFASGLETLADQIPLNNCRWRLYHRGPDGWSLWQADPSGRTREPCPLAAFSDGHLFLSANPTLTEPDHRAGPARPEILQFQASAAPLDPAAAERPSDQPTGQTLVPLWEGQPPFSEHSYRSFAADGPRGALLLLQNIGYGHAEWSFRDADGRWSAQGKLTFPWGADYAQPVPIRICYPNVMLRDRAVYVCGVSDIVEPNPEWRAYKKELTGRDWDYDFRRLFFTWTDDIVHGQFHDWIEIASRDSTAGWIFPADLWAAPDGRVHVMWTERAIDVRLRKRFFPDAKQSHALNYAVVRNGQIESRRTLILAEEDGAGLMPGAARFHVTPDQRLWVICYVSGRDGDGRAVSENRLFEILADGTATSAVRVPLTAPFTSFFTATVRAGSAPSALLDLLGIRSGSTNTISYARIRLGAE